MTKICSKCKIEKDESEFSKSKDKKDGLYCNCKKCIKEHYINNKNKILEKKKNIKLIIKIKFLNIKKNIILKIKIKLKNIVLIIKTKF
jgi:hypothetical protein